MKKQNGWIKRNWNKLRHIKKRNIGIISLWALRAVTLFIPGVLDSEQAEFIRIGIDTLLLGGSFHSFSRTDKVKKIGNNINNLIKIKK